MDQYQGNYTVIGPPGTGKTTYLAKQLDKIAAAYPNRTLRGGTPALVCSLTKTAAAEIAGRVPAVPDAAVATMHAHGWRAMDKPPLANVVVDEFNKLHPGLAVSASNVKIDDDIVGQPKEGEAPGDDLAREYHFLRHAMTPRSKWPQDVVLWAAKWEEWKLESGCVDFTDMIEQAPDEAPMEPAVIIVDEAQDMSALEFDRLQKWSASAGAMITVGDPYQALYTWRGAHPEHLLADRGGEKFKVLSQSWRVPVAIHKEAMQWVSRLTNYTPLDYKPKDEPGLVDSCNATFKDPQPAIDLAVEKAAEGKTVMMITSCNYMCNQMVHEMRDQGIAFSNPWRLTNPSWNPIGPRRGTSMTSRAKDLMSGPDWTAKQFAGWTGCLKTTGLFKRGALKEVKEFAKSYPTATISLEQMGKWCTVGDMFNPTAWDRIWEAVSEGMTDRAIFDRWMDGMKPESVRSARFVSQIAVASGIDELFKAPNIHVGTIHSFKGGEADVVMLFPDISSKAYEGWINMAGEGYDSIIRGYYVGMTRAKQELHLCQPATKLSVEI